MYQITKIFLLSVIVLISFASCGDDEVIETSSSTAELNVNFTGLEDLGSDYAYEGWVIVNGAPVTTGVFTVDASVTPSQTSFEISTEDLESATTFVLTIEPSPDPDPSPSAVHILAGDFSGKQADLVVGHGAALGNDFAGAEGSYILATPTDGNSDGDENSGVWWLEILADGPSAGLDLPALPEGWAYEGWAVVDGTPLSTGRFLTAEGRDDFNDFSGTDNAGPGYPGEDFLLNAPSGLNFPLDLSNQTVVISVEPVPDNSPAPFTLKPLVGAVPSDAADHVSYDMNNNAEATNPFGYVSKNLK